MSVDETLMCSFQILKPAERKIKFMASNKMWNDEALSSSRGSEVSCGSRTILPHAYVLAHKLLDNIVDTREIYSGTNWFSATLVSQLHDYLNTTDKTLVVYHMELEYILEYRFRFSI